METTTATLESPGPVARWELSGPGVEVRHRQALTRVEAVAPDILRVRVAPDGKLPARRPWDPVLELPPAELAATQEGRTLRLAAGALTACLDLSSGALAFATPDGIGFAEDLGPPGWRELALAETGLSDLPEPGLPPGAARLGVFLDKRMAADEGYYGFGQRTGGLDRRRRRLTHWTVDRSAPGHSRGDDHLYQAHPVFMAVRPGLAWGLYLHSIWTSSTWTATGS